MNVSWPTGGPFDAAAWEKDPARWGEMAATAFAQRLGEVEIARLKAATLDLGAIETRGGSPMTPDSGPGEWHGQEPAGRRWSAKDVEQFIDAFERAAEWTRRLTGEWATLGDVVRTGVGGSIETIGDGIANQLVDGTYEWRDAWKNVVKEVIAVAAKMVIIQGVTAAIMGLLGGGGGGSVGALGSLLGFHGGGAVGWPRHHLGEFKADERPAVLQAGEFVMRREASRLIGAPALQEMNRTGQIPARGGDNYHISINVHAESAAEPRDLAERLAEPLLAILRRERGRNRDVA